MFKVLLVDDEIYVRKGLINLIDWSSLHYEICGEAENGLQAIQAISQLKPDLVIVDIRMPVLDGLELIQRVTEEELHKPLFIIVSGYHDFSYAQKALRYNVQDYILKPVDEDELAATLRKIAGTLNQKRLSTLAGEKPITESIVETLLHTEQSEQAVEQMANALRLPAQEDYRYIVLEVQDMQVEGSIDYLPSIQRCLEAIMMEVKTSLLIHVREFNQYGIILPMLIVKEWQGGSLREKFSWLRHIIEQELGVSVALVAGKQVEHLRQITQSFTSANEGLNYKFVIPAHEVVLAEELHQTPLYYFDVAEELHSKLIGQIEENQAEAYRMTIESIFDIFQVKHFAPSAVSNTITRSVIGMINIIRQMGGNEEELSLLNELLSWQKKYRNPSQLKGIYTSFVEEAAAYIAAKRSEQGKGSIEKIKKYIDTHYTENINLKGIAAKFYMNSVYLGQLFRKTYGVYFNEYLLSLRVEEAKRLLRQSDMRMYEVADKVGFQNADYFVTQFEKLEKMTPTDYRNKMLGKK